MKKFQDFVCKCSRRWLLDDVFDPRPQGRIARHCYCGGKIVQRDEI